MLTNFLENTKPFNFLCIYFFNIFLLVCYVFLQVEEEWFFLLKRIVLGSAILFVYLFVFQRICFKNRFLEQTRYPIFFATILFAIFPEIYINEKFFFLSFLILLTNGFLIFVKDEIPTKEDLFNASLLIFLGVFFHNWLILCLLWVWIIVFGYAPQKNRAFFIPFVALGITAIFSFLGILYLDFSPNMLFFVEVSFADYSEGVSLLSSIFLLVFVLFFVFLLFFLPNKGVFPLPAIVFFIFFTEIIIILLSNEGKTVEISFLNIPLALFLAFSVQKIAKIRWKEGILWFFLATALLVLASNFYTSFFS